MRGWQRGFDRVSRKDTADAWSQRHGYVATGRDDKRQVRGDDDRRGRFRRSGTFPIYSTSSRVATATYRSDAQISSAPLSPSSSSRAPSRFGQESRVVIRGTCPHLRRSYQEPRRFSEIRSTTRSDDVSVTLGRLSPRSRSLSCTLSRSYRGDTAIHNARL